MLEGAEKFGDTISIKISLNDGILFLKKIYNPEL